MDLELDQFRDVDLVIDRANDSFVQKQFVSQGDYKGRSLTVQVTDNGVVGEVAGLTLNLRWTNQASGLTDLSAFTVIDKASSVFRIEYPEHMMTPGEVIASIQVLQDGKSTFLKSFTLTVQQLAGEAIGIAQKAEFSALVAVLADSNKFRTDIDALNINKVTKGENESITSPMLAKSLLEDLKGGSIDVNVNTSMIEDDAVSYPKLSTNLKARIFDSSAVAGITFETNAYINYTNGKKVAIESPYIASSFIEITNDKLDLNDYDLITAKNARGLAYYSSPDETAFVSGYQYAGDNSTILIEKPATANYLRFTARIEKIDDVRLSIHNIVDTLNKTQSLINDNYAIKSLNLIDDETIIWGKYINPSGTESTHADLGATDYIDIPSDSVIRLGNVIPKKVTDIRSCAVYDRNKNPIKIIQYSTLNLEIQPEIIKTSPEARFFRASVTKGVPDPFVILENTATVISNIAVAGTKPLSLMRYDGGYATIFHKIGFIGDSLSSGEVEFVKEDGSIGRVDLYDFSFGKRVGEITGNECLNFSRGGLTAKAAYNNYNTELQNEENICTAYNIYLGTNDRNNTPYPVGTKSDIDLTNKENNADSFYGWYGKIIQRIKEVQPRAKIFLMTLPKNAQSTKSVPYNECIKDLATIFSNCFVIDTYNDWDEQSSAWMKLYGSGTHLNAVGYQKYAYNWVTHVNFIIENNLIAFRDVAFIGRNETPYYAYD